ncbi:MAG: galactose mutarotase [Muribaculaceae bacterium]|nr:galactose mutarotase [Muribaculaceae bacterium]
MKAAVEIIHTPKGDITLYRLVNESGASVTLSSLGAGVVSIEVPDREGIMTDVVLGYEHPVDYFYDGPCAGKTPGRYANRIAGGKFTLNGVEYQLNINNGPNALHGGPEGFQNQIWECSLIGVNQVNFFYSADDGEENYPGAMMVRVEYTWTEDNRLTIRYRAVALNAPTIVNLTNHTYFNLAGSESGSVLNHELQLNASRYLPTDETLIPTGELAAVEGTPMDFTAKKRIGRDIKQDFPALRYGKGYDNCWVLDENAMEQPAATLFDPASGRKLRVFTDQPAVQVYTGNWLEGSPLGKNGREFHDYDGVAIECQGFPDAPNHPAFPSQELWPDEEYARTIIFDFSIEK